MSLDLPLHTLPPAFAEACAADVARLDAALGPERSTALDTLFTAHPARRAELARLLCISRFALREFERHPELLADLLQSGDLVRDYDEGEYLARSHVALAGATAEEPVMRALRTFRRREMLRIVWREQCALAEIGRAHV